jgi:hypothetical protein
METAVKNVAGPTIALVGGTYFDYMNPLGSDFNIYDVAHGLSNICRFGGQCQEFYSVAEHSVHVSNIIEKGYEYEGLMHDAAEAFIGDIPKPLKHMLKDYMAIEYRAEIAVMDRFKVKFPFSPPVKVADLQMLKTEQAQAMRNGDNWQTTGGENAAEIRINFWTPDEAKEQFLERFHEIYPYA